jgi:hypothetical protein
VDLPTRATVKVVTEEEVGVPLGFETPLIHALIDLGGRLTLFTRIANCKVGQLEGDEAAYVFLVDPVPIQVGRKWLQRPCLLRFRTSEEDKIPLSSPPFPQYWGQGDTSFAIPPI